MRAKLFYFVTQGMENRLLLPMRHLAQGHGDLHKTADRPLFSRLSHMSYTTMLTCVDIGQTPSSCRRFFFYFCFEIKRQARGGLGNKLVTARAQDDRS